MDKHQIMIAQNLFRVFLFFSLSLSLAAQPKLPKEPNLPNVIGSEKKEDRDARGDTREQKTIVQNLTLCDGRTVRGEGTILTEGIQFIHVKDGIEYKKKLKMEEIESIRIETWELKQKKEEKKGISFEAMPKKIRIRARSGESYYKESGLADLKLLNLEIKNNNGAATLYSYWIDLRYPNGTWFSGLPAIKNDGLVRDDCLKDVVRLIEWE
ncbi:hypothetical protein [Leptospira sp. 'Mane']|uniref:hypothetical protein n=1 Tax=Leptospira sp. 'Mane' TaxID=3387407 RepID=UPI00398BB429